MPPRNEDLKRLCFLELFVGGSYLLFHLFLVRFGKEGPYRQASNLPSLCRAHAPWLQDARKTFISPKQTPDDTGRTASDGDTLVPSHTRPWREGTAPARQLLRVLRHLFVCSSPGNREDGKKKYQCHIVTYESPLSTGRDGLFLPPPSTGRLEKSPGHPKSGSPQLLLPGPAPMPSPSPQPGPPVAQGHRWPRDNFPGPGRQHRNLHLYLHFLIAPAGFLGQRLALVSMAGFVWARRTKGGTKGPQWTCHSPASKAAGVVGQGHRGWGHRSLPPPAPTALGRMRGAPQAGEEAGLTPTRHWWFRHCGSSSGDASLNHHHPEVAAAEVVQEPAPDVPPVLASRYFQPAFHPAEVGFFPLPTSLFHLGTVLPARVPALAHLTHHCTHPAPALTPGNQETDKTGAKTWENLVPEPLLQAQCHRAEGKLWPTSLCTPATVTATLLPRPHHKRATHHHLAHLQGAPYYYYRHFSYFIVGNYHHH